MNGHLGNLDKRQAAALEKFRNNVSDVLQPHDDDYFLLRWLRARQFDVKKSETMLRNSLTWRVRVGADSILDEEHSLIIRKYFTGGFYGHAKNGSPVFFDPFGYIDVKGICHSVRKVDILRYEAFMAETMMRHCRQQTEKLGKQIETFVVVFDLANYGRKHLSKIGLEFQLDMLQVFEYNYPETMEMAFVINAPSIFPIAYKIFCPFLSEDTKRKVRVLGRDYKEELQKFIDIDELPEFYGGTGNDPPGDPKCSAKIVYGGEVPKELYRAVDPTERESWDTCIVKKRSTVQIDYKVTTPGTIISWQFSTDDYDIGFGIYRRTQDKRQNVGDMEVIQATERVNSHFVPEEGHIVCDSKATYVLRFDNTFSWSKSKKLYHCINLITPHTGLSSDAESDASQSHAAKSSTSVDTEKDWEIMGKDSSSSSDENDFHMMPNLPADTRKEYELL